MKNTFMKITQYFKNKLSVAPYKGTEKGGTFWGKNTKVTLISDVKQKPIYLKAER